MGTTMSERASKKRNVQEKGRSKLEESTTISKKPRKARKDALQEALEGAGFSIFRRLRDLGFVAWQPPLTEKLKYKSLGNATASEIQAYTRFGQLPPRIVDIDNISLPLTLSANPRKYIVAPRFPYAHIAVAPLYHAFTHCNVDKESIDFVFGCSALEVLVSCRTPKKAAPYLVMKVPGTNALMLHYHFQFGQDYAQPGFQFERLMTQQNMQDAHNHVGTTEHVQLMEIGGKRVLMTAEVDGVDAVGNPVELKLGSSGIGRKVMFQMIGSGSLTLIKGGNDKGIVRSIRSTNLADIMSNVVSEEQNTVAFLETKILDGMNALKAFDDNGYFDNGKVYRIEFQPKMTLVPFGQNHPLLPPNPVLGELF